MTGTRAIKGLALLTGILYSGLAWLWYVELIPGAGGLHPFDSRFFGYTAAEGQAFLSALSDEARQVYLADVRLLDTIFPICLAALLSWLMLRRASGPWRALAILPVAYLATDLLENARVAAILLHAAPTDEMIVAASQATVAKYGFLIISAIALGAIFVTTKRP
ncbi:hypothetical protein KUL25_18675 [Rhodobacteraceae bacterium N5(2021)]|uniref:Uncharacterized protein n=1 Tax=Gymnodinialimonas phycosphaerae TaxID=2841589 RepID=A0A975TUD0_9RHOB|nr:hypothetical protein [Gymnodinialimonas phycosphaerae]MBY4894786.1 hypothetical protein [Gymnodinialimonas phycosphaerae]